MHHLWSPHSLKYVDPIGVIFLPRNQRFFPDRARVSGRILGQCENPQGWILGFFEHGQYMGLTESEIQAAMNDTATTVVDGLTTYYTIPDPSNLIDTTTLANYHQRLLRIADQGRAEDPDRRTTKPHTDKEVFELRMLC